MNDRNTSGESQSNSAQSLPGGKKTDGSHLDKDLKPLNEPQTEKTQWLFIVVELVHLLGLFLSHTRNAKSARATDVLYEQFLRHLNLLSRMPSHDGSILLRQIPQAVAETVPTVPPYLIRFGPIEIWGDSILHESERNASHLTSTLVQAFGCLTEQGIHALLLRFPGRSKKEIEQLRLALNIVARFDKAVEQDSSITFRYFGRAMAIPLIRNREGYADPNLTLTAGINGLSAVNTRELLKQAEAMHAMQTGRNPADPPPGSYAMLFSLPSLRMQLVQPLVEINNMPWKQVMTCPENAEPESGQTPAKGESHSAPDQKSKAAGAAPGAVARPSYPVFQDLTLSPEYLIKCLIQPDEEARRLCRVMFADDLQDLESGEFGARLLDYSRLLRMLEETSSDASAPRRVIRFLQDQMESVAERFFQRISLQRQAIRMIEKDRSFMVGMVHPTIIDLIRLSHERLLTRQKLEVIKALGFDFKKGDNTALAERFEVNAAEILPVINFLKGCFMEAGSFQLSVFRKSLDDAIHDGTILFEMLWCYLKQAPESKDRLDILRAMRMLIARLRDRKRALRFLLADVFQLPFELAHGDRNALILASLLMHHHQDELGAESNQTPETVIGLEKGIDQQIQAYAVWRVDFDQIRVLTKIRTLHDLIKNLASTSCRNEFHSFNAWFLLALEREFLLFFALAGGDTARIILRDTLARYGNPSAKVYSLQAHKTLFPHIMANLKIAVRGLGSAGRHKDLDSLKEFEKSAVRLRMIDSNPYHGHLVNLTLKQVEPAMKSIQLRMHS